LTNTNEYLIPVVETYECQDDIQNIAYFYIQNYYKLFDLIKSILMINISCCIL